MNKEELIQEIVRITSVLDKLEEKLADICEDEIRPLVKAKKYKEAKEKVLYFYKDCVDEQGNSISTGKDTILSTLNFAITFNKN